jgi:hypothetical protein
MRSEIGQLLCDRLERIWTETVLNRSNFKICLEELKKITKDLHISQFGKCPNINGIRDNFVPRKRLSIISYFKSTEC